MQQNIDQEGGCTNIQGSVALCHRDSTRLHLTTRNILFIGDHPLLQEELEPPASIHKSGYLNISCLSGTSKRCWDNRKAYLRKFNTRSQIQRTSETPSNTCFDNISTFLHAAPTIFLYQNKPQSPFKICVKATHKPRFRCSWVLAVRLFTYNDDQIKKYTLFREGLKSWSTIIPYVCR